MQLVQTRIRLLPPPTFAFTGRRLTFQRRRLMLCAWEMLLPNWGPLPQTSHTCAMTNSRTRLETCTRRNRHAENHREPPGPRPGPLRELLVYPEKPFSDNWIPPMTGILLATPHESDRTRRRPETL